MGFKNIHSSAQSKGSDSVGSKGEIVGDNRDRGISFEQILQKQARRNGLFCEKNNLTAMFINGSRPLIKKSELDFKLITQQGRVAFVDAKCYEGTHFIYSQLLPKQVERAVNYNAYLVPSGFVVWFRGSGLVRYYKGFYIAEKGKRSRFDDTEGMALGTWDSFDLKRIFE